MLDSVSYMTKFFVFSNPLDTQGLFFHLVLVDKISEGVIFCLYKENQVNALSTVQNVNTLFNSFLSTKA